MMKLQEQYQELDEDHPTPNTISMMTTPVVTSSTSSSGSSHNSAVSQSISSSMLHNLSSNNDNNTTLPMTNGVISHQQRQQQGPDDDAGADVTLSTEQKRMMMKKKKNSLLLWLFLFLLLIGLIIVVVVTTRVVKNTQQRRSRSSSRSSSSINTNAAGTQSSSLTATPTTVPAQGTTNATSIAPSAPSLLPSSSSFPSSLASVRRPTVSPTAVNITAVNHTNANATTHQNTTAPSAAPQSNRPSTATPTRIVTRTPTTVPSTLPTHSVTPTELTWDIPSPEELYQHLYTTQNVPKEFRIKMHYEPRYLWQEETIERRWCIECTTCPYNNFDLTNTVCDIVQQCSVGNQIWLVNCDAGYGQIFTIRPHVLPHIPIALRSRLPYNTTGNNTEEDPISKYYYHQIQIVQNATTINNGVYTNGNPTVVNNTNFTFVSNSTNDVLCLERTETRFVTIQVCQNYTTFLSDTKTEYNAEQLAQLWDPLVSYYHNNATGINIANDGITVSNSSYLTFTMTPGILLPKDMDSTNNATITWCLTNQHHPKSEEIAALKPCNISNHYNTGFWNIYPTP